MFTSNESGHLLDQDDDGEQDNQHHNGRGHPIAEVVNKCVGDR